MRFSAILLTSALSLLALPAAFRAGRRQVPREPPGLDFTPNGVWRQRARRVAEQRGALLAGGRFADLNAPMSGMVSGAAAPALTGVLRVPVVLFKYSDTPDAFLRDTAMYSSLLFGSTPPLGRPYTYRGYYEELSHSLFSVQGDVYGYAPLSRGETAYTGGVSTTCAASNPYGTGYCNGVWSFAAESSMQAGLREALARMDTTIDFSRYDADGDGIVDLVVFVQPLVDGACNSPHLWSHRFALFSVWASNDPAPGGGHERVSSYILQSGVGGSGSCDGSQYMSIGTIAHETGHGLGLPDLYDVSYATQGIGDWGLMGSGNLSTGDSPSRMEAWSLNRLGWVTVVPLTATGTYAVGPAPTSDTAFYVRAGAPNYDGEYFLLENRQAVQSDSALIRVTGPGLLIWHADSARIADGLPYNYVNTGSPHGLRLEEADGLGQLWCGANGCNRGDGGDPYPGTSGNPVLSWHTNPSAQTSYGAFVGFAIDSIRQLVPNGAMAFRLHFGAFTQVSASDSRASVQVDGAPYQTFSDLFEDGSTHSIAIADTQFVDYDGRTELDFQSWSDGGAASHVITGSFSGANYMAAVTPRYRLALKVDAHGSVVCSIGPCPGTAYFTPATAIVFTAVPDSGFAFGIWAGPDTIVSNPVVAVSMLHPYDLEVRFDTLLTVASTLPRPSGVMGRQYADTLVARGGFPGAHLWDLVSGTPPPGIGVGYYGAIEGVPTAMGSYVFVVRVSSGAQSQTFTDSIAVTAPVLDRQAVVAQLLTGRSSLTIDELRYLDLLGNKNCPYEVPPTCFDVGDFLAWVKTTGVQPPAALVARLPAPTAAPRRAGEARP